MWRKLVFFATLLSVILALEYVMLEQPTEPFIVPTSWVKLFTAISLAAGATWFWFRFRSIRSNR